MSKLIKPTAQILQMYNMRFSAVIGGNEGCNPRFHPLINRDFKTLVGAVRFLKKQGYFEFRVNLIKTVSK